MTVIARRLSTLELRQDGRVHVRCWECSDVAAHHEADDLAGATAWLREHPHTAPAEHPWSLRYGDRLDPTAAGGGAGPRDVARVVPGATDLGAFAEGRVPPWRRTSDDR